MSGLSTQKAWTYTNGGFPPSTLHLSTIPIPSPTTLSPTELLITTHAASLNPVDAQLMSIPLWPYIPSFLLPFEKGVGEDFSGTILAVGSACHAEFKVGDEVFGIIPFLPWGTLQEVVRVDVQKGVVLSKPKDWSWEEAASLPLVWLTAMTLVEAVEGFVPGGKGGRIVVLGGSSSCGMYVTHIAKQRGWKVLASCSGKNAEFVRGMGAGEIVDYTISPSVVPDAIKSFSPHTIIDCVGGVTCLNLAPRYVSVVGDKTNRMSMGGAAIYLWNPQMALRSLKGWMGLGPSYACVNLRFEKRFLETVLGLKKEKIVVDGVWKFEEVREAFEKMNGGRVRGKVVVRIAE